MSKLVIKLDKSYKVPSNILKLTEEEWQIILTSLDKFINVHDINILQLSTDKLQTNIELQYKEQLSTLNEQVAKYQEQISTLQTTHTNLLTKQRKELEEQYNSILNEVVECKVNTKDKIIDTLKEQVTTLQLQLSEINKVNLDKTDNLQQTLYNTTLELENYKKEVNNKILEERERQTQLYEDKLTNLHKLHSIEIQQATTKQVETILFLQEQLNKMNKEHNTELESVREEANTKLLTKLEPLLKVFGGSNLEKGDGGEDLIRTLLLDNKLYTDAVIEDVSGVSASGDIIFKWKGLKCLIEVKNKKVITIDDTNKFIRDVQAQSERGVNCAVFISLRTNIIPHKTRELIQVEYLDGMPIVYAYVKPPCHEIYYVMTCLEKIFNSSIDKSHHTTQLQQYFIDYYTQIINYQHYFEKELKKKQREIKDLISHNEYFSKLYDQLAPAYSKISKNNELDYSEDESIDEEAQEEKIELEADIDKQLVQLSEKYIKLSLKQQTPTIDKLNDYFDEKTQIPFKTISANAKNYYLQKVIDESRIKNIKNFYKLNGKYPNRKELIEQKIVPEYVMRNISKVIKNKKVAESIEEYISTLEE
jgi:hypothetical protein